MPTFFARKYMRKGPGRTERIIGALLLAAVLLLLATFGVTGGLWADRINAVRPLRWAKNLLAISEAPLFQAQQLSPPAPPRAQRVAEVVLPVLADPWRRKEMAVYQVDAAQNGFMQSIAAWGARHIYQGQYQHKTADFQVRVVEALEPVKASAICAARRPVDAQALPLGRDGWQGMNRCGFWAGRYYTEISAEDSVDARVLHDLARAIVSGQLVYGGPFDAEPAGYPSTTSPPGDVQPIAEKTQPIAGRARFVEIPGSNLLAPIRIERYAENLYEKIDGKEGMFRAFHVVDLRFGQYLEQAGRQAYDVYVYDMAEPANAMGIFMKERPRNADNLEIGRSAYRSGGSVYFWKGPYYLNVLGPGEGGDETFAVSRRIAEAIAETIADDGQPFWAESVLPLENRLPGTFRYAATSALGYEYLERMFLADYEEDGKSYQMFILKADNREQARDLFRQYVESTQRYDKVLKQEDTTGGQTMVGESMGIFTTAFYRDEYFGGVCECEDGELAQSRASLLRDRLAPNENG